MNARILIVDDDLDLCEVLVAALRARGFEPTFTLSPVDALATLQQDDFAAVVTDVAMPGMLGTELCHRLTTNHPNVPVIVITAFGSLDTAVAAIRAGAYDFVTKPLDSDELALILERAIQHRLLCEEVIRLRHTLDRREGFSNLLGKSSQMEKLYSLLSRIADSEASILITGETGTGKELIARAIHDSSRRSIGPFVPVNCASIPESLLESELFGHTKGAYTDARTERKGLFVQADGGTLFLDEIGNMPLSFQAKLLRVIQDRRLRPVGSDSERSVDVRIISATNRDLESAILEGQFREDLFYRINVIHVETPPLRSRGNDVLLLAQHFVREQADRSGKNVVGLSTGAAQKLLAYSWPGNVRELQNCIERAVALADCDHVMVDDLPAKISAHEPSHVLVTSDDPSELATMEEVERRYIQRVLEAVSGNKTLAARILGFDRKTLYRKLDQYGHSRD